MIPSTSGPSEAVIRNNGKGNSRRQEFYNRTSAFYTLSIYSMSGTVAKTFTSAKIRYSTNTGEYSTFDFVVFMKLAEDLIDPSRYRQAFDH